MVVFLQAAAASGAPRAPAPHLWQPNPNRGSVPFLANRHVRLAQPPLAGSAMNRLPAIRVPSGRARRSGRRPVSAAALFAGLVCALSVFPAGRAEVYHFIEFDPDRRDVRSWDPGVWFRATTS